LIISMHLPATRLHLDTGCIMQLSLTRRRSKHENP
jgi:hypothetical protein